MTEKLFDQMGHQHAAAINRQELLTLPAQVKWSESRSHVEGSSQTPGTSYTVVFTTVPSQELQRLVRTDVERQRIELNCLDKRSCTCMKWTQHGVPCSHAYVDKGLFKAGEVLDRTYDSLRNCVSL